MTTTGTRASRRRPGGPGVFVLGELDVQVMGVLMETGVGQEKRTGLRYGRRIAGSGGEHADRP